MPKTCVRGNRKTEGELTTSIAEGLTIETFSNVHRSIRVDWKVRPARGEAPGTKYYKGKRLQEMIQRVGRYEIPGLVEHSAKKPVLMEVLNQMDNDGLAPYIMGGFIRDSLMNKLSNDIDLTFACSYERLLAFARHCENKNYRFKLMERGKVVSLNKAKLPSYICLGDGLVEGKVLIANESDVRRELPVRDFTFNELLYSHIHNVLIDPSGYGIWDTLNEQLRIPVDIYQQENTVDWLHDRPDGLPFNRLFRWFKFRGRGYKSADLNQLKWIICTLEENVTKPELQGTFLYYLAREFNTKQKGKKAAEKEETGTKLAVGFLQGIMEDIATAKDGMDGRKWFYQQMLPWIPENYDYKRKKVKLRAYFEQAFSGLNTDVTDRMKRTRNQRVDTT